MHLEEIVLHKRHWFYLHAGAINVFSVANATKNLSGDGIGLCYTTLKSEGHCNVIYLLTQIKRCRYPLHMQL